MIVRSCLQTRPLLESKVLLLAIKHRSCEWVEDLVKIEEKVPTKKFQLEKFCTWSMTSGWMQSTVSSSLLTTRSIPDSKSALFGEKLIPV